jgi:hypothetical protein
MKIQINPKEFIAHFINPINELNKEGKIAIFTHDNELYSVSSTKSRTIHLYNTYRPLNISESIDRCSINVLKLIKGLQCINNDETFISLDFSLENGMCSFSTNDIKFNIRLLDDNLVDVPKFNINTFRQFEVHHSLEISVDKVNNIRKALEFSTDTCKFYLQQEENSVYFYFGDKSATHYDDIKILVTDSATSIIPQKAYDIDILRFILKAKNDFSMKLNDNGVMYIEVENPNTNLKYITTPLIK